LAAADKVPTFDLNPTCEGAQPGAGAGGGGEDVCRKSELSARDILVQHWKEYPSADRNRCVDVTTMARIPSYVQVLTCLGMARESRNLSNARQRTTGQTR